MESFDALTPEFLALQAAVAGRYSLVRELGRGGTGVVFLAREVALDRLVAIKLLPTPLAASPVLRERFLREARTAAGLAHPHIVPIHAVESHDSLVWFAMEYVPGETLGGRLQSQGTIATAAALRIVQETAWALAHAHARGVIHRDVKPDNILLEAGTDRVMVTDFGIARGADGEDSAAGHGTPHYMSPEQLLGESNDARVDVYALGVTAWHALTGRRPFESMHGAALIAAQSGSDAPPITTVIPALPTAVAHAIDRAVQRDPTARWSSMEEFAQALGAARALEPQLPIPVRRFARHAMEHGERLWIVLWASVSAGLSAAFTDAFVASFFGFEIFTFVVVGSLGVCVSIALLLRHMREIRGLAAQGYTRQSALRGIAGLEAEDEGEVFPRGATGWFANPPAVVFTGTMSTIAGIMLTSAAESILTFAPGLMLALTAPALTARYVARLKGHTGSWWGRVLRSKWGARLWSLATFRMNAVREAPTGGEPTALAVGSAVQALYAALPDSEQKLLAEVPDLVTRLEAHALERGTPRALEAMTALETLRMDLMRLRAGQMKADGMTEDIARLREIGYYVDAKDEVER